jgi:hypothetical protein
MASFFECFRSAPARALGAVGVVLVPILGCSSTLPPSAPPQADGAQVARCNVGASHERPFVTEWPATERSRLESKMASGLVAVSYSGCQMQVLDRCRAEGSYRFVRTSVATDGFTITNGDELYAKLPLGAVSLEGELQRTGKLSLSYAVVGQYDAGDADPARVKLVGDCAGATHLVTGYAVGAFSLASGSSDSVGGGVSVPIAGGGAKRSQSQDVIRSSGGLDACKDEPAGAKARTQPPEGCRTPIQLFLAALPGREGGASAAAGASAGVKVQGASVGEGAVAVSGSAAAIPDLRVVGYFGAGVVGGGEFRTSPSQAGWAGPSGTGALGLRYRMAEDLEVQVRGSAGVSGDLKTPAALIPLGLDASLRIRPRSWSFYVGGGGGGSLTIIPKDVPYVLWHGLRETGFVFGATEAWDFGVRGGVGSTFTAALPALYNASLVLGRSFN